LELDLGLSRGLATGGTVAATLTSTLQKDRFLPDGLPSVTQLHQVTNTGAISLVQPILRGNGVRIARADRRRAVVARDVATLQQVAEGLNLTRDVVVGYWQVANAHQ